MSLFALIGAVDNLDEPTPLINRRTTILGLVITFLVITSDLTKTPETLEDMLTMLYRSSPHFVSACGYMSGFS